MKTIKELKNKTSMFLDIKSSKDKDSSSSPASSASSTPKYKSNSNSRANSSDNLNNTNTSINNSTGSSPLCGADILKKNEKPKTLQYLPSNINNLVWERATSVEKISYGENTHFLVVTFQPNPLVEEYFQVLLKSSTSIGQEVYVSILESILKFPIPEMRLLEFSDEEYQEMSKSLTFLSDQNSNLNSFIKKELKKSFFLVMEYNPDGKTLKELNYKEYFTGTSGDKKLIQLGQIIAFDMFCNNWDRFPLIWDNNGNFSNILFYEQPIKNGWYFSLIDSNISCINNSSFTVGYHRYINRLKSLLYSIFKNPNMESNQVKKLRELICKTFEINLNESSGVLLQKGILQGVQLIVNTITLNILKDTKEKLQHLVKCDTDNIWKKSIDSIYLPFLMDVLDKFDEFESSNHNNKK
ncbi:hypothetical protein CYY_003662 [Polysphondylium violaceum]|uniref:Actin-fragmin kinase catalytic domain-containing protein n=1 Tax=Polysphondylium violaceum TaxID=133409 RepID=A0A8J4PWH7_9MYCE|nr:hypothetical protein CYY_003662 [Polysphondylium violaceum]